MIQRKFARYTTVLSKGTKIEMGGYTATHMFKHLDTKHERELVAKE